MTDMLLPPPESERLAALVGEGALRLAYGLLYRRRGHPPTADEIGFFLRTAVAEGRVEQVLRGLRKYFEITAVHVDGVERYELRGWAKSRPAAELTPISLRLRAQALAPGRCAMCGRTPLQHGVVLEVDLRVPPEWGGTNDPENLRPLCEECRDGRQQYLQAYAPYAEQIAYAAQFDEPQRRIGELLRAFRGEWVSSDLIGIVASAKEYQEDYQRRIRELRDLGWEYQQKKSHDEGARVKVYYRLVHDAPWPENIRAAIRAAENKRKEARATAQTARRIGSD
jgi:hypothetical protein